MEKCKEWAPNVGLSGTVADRDRGVSLKVPEVGPTPRGGDAGGYEDVDGYGSGGQEPQLMSGGGGSDQGIPIMG